MTKYFGDPITEPFWDAARQHRLVAQYSPTDDAYQLYPRLYMAGTGSDDIEWRELSGKGTVYSVTQVCRAMLGSVKVPYFSALVDLDEGPRLLSRVVSANCTIGDRVEVQWEARGDDPPFPVFRVVS